MALLASVMGATRAEAQDTGTASETPQLRVRSPFAASVFRLDVDAAERTLALSNAYGAATLWTLPEDGAYDVLRVPRRNEQAKRAHAIAVSPDGALVAYAVPPAIGPAGHADAGTAQVHILERNGGRIAATIDGLDTRAQALRFSPDGRFLAATLSSGCGLRVWSVGEWSPVGADDAGYGGGPADSLACCPSRNADQCEGLPDTTGLAITGDAATGFLVATSGDSGVRTYRLGAAGLVRTGYAMPAALGLERPAGVDISGDGKRLVVGERRCFVSEQRPELAGHRTCTAPGTPPSLRVALVDALSLAPAGPPMAVPFSAFSTEGQSVMASDAGNQANLDRVAFGRHQGHDVVFAAGFIPCATLAAPSPVPGGRLDPDARSANCIVRFEGGGGSAASGVFLPAASDRIADLRFLKTADALVIAAQDGIRVLDGDGGPRVIGGRTFDLRREAADFRDGEMEFRVSPDGRQVVFEDYRSTDGEPLRVRFRVDGPSVRGGATSDPALVEPVRDTAVVGQPARWKNSVRNPPVLRGTALDAAGFGKDETSRAVALVPERALAAFASSEAIRLYRYDGPAPRLACRLSVTEEVLRITFAVAGNLIVSGHSDGTLRWHRVTWTSAETCRLDRLLTAYIVRTGPHSWGHFTVTADGRFAFDPALRDDLEWQAEDASGRVRVTRFTALSDWHDRAAVAAALNAVQWQPPAALAAAPALATHLTERAEPAPALYLLDYPSVADVRRNPVRLRFAVDAGAAPPWPKMMGARLADGTPLAVAFGGTRHEPGAAIPLASTDEIDVRVELPVIARQRRGLVTVCIHLDGRDHACADVDWQGEVAPPPPRRLWAVLVGLARYDAPSLRLPFADNDVVDLAGLFAADFEARRTASSAQPGTAPNAATPSQPPDFASIDLTLALSRLGTPEAEVAALAGKPFVRIIAPGRAEILSAVRAIAEQARIEDLSNDLFLFYFSGHGVLRKGSGGVGFTALALPSFLPDGADLEADALLSRDLLDLFQRIPSQKLIVIDACRNWRTTTAGAAFSPSEAILEFARGSLSAQFLFSAHEGQVSRTSPDVSFSPTRPAPFAGNSLFTYALLGALTKPEAIGVSARAAPTLVEVRANLLKVGIDRYFTTAGLIGQQNPVEVPARVPRLDDVLRRYRLAPVAEEGN
ncbi:MAG: caspase family protein [Hyphomicrobiaceae bacterium]|nr:caspase family protein [Hyphomicrobiaceae bacterium]